ncbi:MAG: hypothetical protein MMC33_001886 [Icmadophila ericetorum]|nr:hypothetical protein [Icmadophila ericetorum]
MSLPSFSTLSSKPPQRPDSDSSSTSNSNNLPLHSSPTTTRDLDQDPSALVSPRDVAHHTGVTPSVANWRPSLDRQQSWNEQDMKRKFQERLLSPTAADADREAGWSTAGTGSGK